MSQMPPSVWHSQRQRTTSVASPTTPTAGLARIMLYSSLSMAQRMVITPCPILACAVASAISLFFLLPMSALLFPLRMSASKSASSQLGPTCAHTRATSHPVKRCWTGYGIVEHTPCKRTQCLAIPGEQMYRQTVQGGTMLPTSVLGIQYCLMVRSVIDGCGLGTWALLFRLHLCLLGIWRALGM